MGGGKALRHGMPVLTSTGFKNIEDIYVGDKVITPTEGDQSVTGVYPQGEVDIYRVSFQDGSFVDTCGEHLWEVRQSMRKSRNVISTLDIKEIIEREAKKPAGTRLWPLIPLCGEVSFSEAILPVKPYVLGVLLGDGGMTGLSTILTSADQHVVDAFNANGHETTKLTCDKYSYYVKGLKSLTELLGVRVKSQFKFVPTEYKTSSVAQRYELLKGLFDSDGTVSNDGKVYYATTSKELAFDVQEIIRSLGGTATISEKIKTFTYKGEKKKGLLCYELYVRHPNPNNLFSLPRKLGRLTKDKRLIENRVVSVEPLTKDLATCISISGDRKLFITKDYLVTHNTYNGLLKQLKWVDNPHYRGLVVRKSSSTIMKSGFLFDEAKGLYTSFDKNVQVKYKAQKFVFPAKSEIVFTHLATDEDAESFRGGQFSHALIDEATELKEDHVLRVFSRIRSKAGIPPQMVLTANPNPDSYLRKWIDWYLYPEGHEHAGRADPEKDGVMRYFIRIGDEMCWGDSKDELITRYGNPDLPKDHVEQVKPISFCFYPATIFDNPPLIKLNPMYLANLMSLKDVQKERDLWGNWDVREGISTYWQRSWVTEIIETPPTVEFSNVCRCWDFADKMPSSTNTSPDYTVSMKMGLLKNGDFVILDVTRHRVRTGDWLNHILEIAALDGNKVDIVIPQDPGVQAKLGAQQQLLKPLNAAGYYATFKQTNQKKLERFRPFSAASQNGYVYVMKSCGNDFWNKITNDNNFWYKELEAFTGERKRGEANHDDICDAASDCYMYLATAKALPVGFLSGMSAFDTSNKSPLLNI